MSTYEVPNLVYGMHHLNITQLPGGDFSHPNMAMDLAGQDAGVDFWFAKCCDWKCIAGEWGSGTYFFIPCDSKGNHINIMCADGKQRKITIALTHSKKQYVKTERGKIYSKNQPMYEEGTKGKATGNHIHLEIAEGYKTTKYYDSKLGVYTMGNELNPVKMFYVLDGYTKVVNTKGATLPHTKSEYTKVVTTSSPAKPSILFVGNSYTYKPNDKECLPQQFKAICKANGVDVDVTMIAEGGWTFEKHWNNSATTTALKSKKYKYVIMQGQSEEVGCMNGEMKISAKTYGKKLADLAKQYGATVYFMSQADYYFRKWSDGSKTTYNMKYQNNVDANYKTLGYPVAYGGKEVKRQANGSYSTYFASDGYHPTAKAQKIIAQVIWDSLRQYLKPIKYVNATGVASYYDKNKGGTYKVVAKDGLNIRNDGVQSAKSLGVLPYNTEFKTYGYYDKDSQGREWLYGVARVGNTEYTGFCCSKSYLKKV